MAFTEDSELHVFPASGQAWYHHDDDTHPQHQGICRQPGGAAFDITGATITVTLTDVKARADTVDLTGTVVSAAAGTFYFTLTAEQGAALRAPGTFEVEVKLNASGKIITSTNRVQLIAVKK